MHVLNCKKFNRRFLRLGPMNLGPMDRYISSLFTVYLFILQYIGITSARYQYLEVCDLLCFKYSILFPAVRENPVHKEFHF